ncbi:site-specific DNA-methyltransferase [Stappia sp. GBMRC 2046]|uniref:Methyltransferase n=1 Tax=Stappia sediminis TaxID=2692190 RepID=A0A7X3LQN6_9HYPH|nr:site-specific DNA-methyltransferase [Stappia sediminis]MXN63318.1 site-specific DNA-methyltransferase [Stappia sediminis]
MKETQLDNEKHRLLQGDAALRLRDVPDGTCRLVITSPPYNIGKEYERDRRRTLDEYIEWLDPIVQACCDKVAEDGHLCWQVGNHLKDGEVFPLDYFFYSMISRRGFKLRNRIIWHFNFGLHATKRFSGRYETLLWFSKSDKYYFNLDPVRVPQLYPGKRHARGKGARAGQPSGNPAGKNPTDFWTFDPNEALNGNPIWDLPNIKSRHPEKTIHPCQFPSELVERCVLAFTEAGDTVLDPFVGAGTTVIAAAKHQRIGVGIDQSEKYIQIARSRLQDFLDGDLELRPFGKPVRRPRSGERVATVPAEWQTAAE